MWSIWRLFIQIMPGAGLLQRAVSLRLKQPKPQSSDLGEPDILDSRFTDARSFRKQHRYRHSQEQSTDRYCRPVPPHPDLAKRAVPIRTGSDRHTHSQSDTSSTPNSTADYVIPEEVITGIALGSPRENPLPPIPADSEREDVSSVCSSLRSPVAVGDHNSTDLALQKGRRWRTFTGLFNKKDASSHFYLLGQNPPRRDLSNQYKSHKKKAHSTHHNCESEYSSRRPQELDRPLPPTPRRGMFRSGEARPRRLIDSHDQLRKENRKDGGNHAVKKSRSWPLSYSARKALSVTKERHHSSQRFIFEAKDDALLQVEIPSVHLERYSVMFSSLLDPAQPKSILAGRRGTLAEIELAATDRNETESIRITQADSEEVKHAPVQISKCTQDVVLAKSGQPVVSISPTFLSSHPAAMVPLERSTLHCCHTAAAQSLPIEPEMKSSKSYERNCVMFLDSNPVQSLGKENSSNGLSSTLDLNRCHPPISGRYQELTGCAELGEKDEILPPLPLNPGVGRVSCLRHHEGNPSISIYTQLKPKERTINDAAEISIARQISVSKRQRQLLVPIVSKQARQPMHPKLVIDGDQDARSRKSHHLTVEHA